MPLHTRDEACLVFEHPGNGLLRPIDDGREELLRDLG
jgi:hypothetical protein